MVVKETNKQQEVANITDNEIIANIKSLVCTLWSQKYELWNNESWW